MNNTAPTSSTVFSFTGTTPNKNGDNYDSLLFCRKNWLLKNWFLSMMVMENAMEHLFIQDLNLQCL